LEGNPPKGGNFFPERRRGLPIRPIISRRVQLQPKAPSIASTLQSPATVGAVVFRGVSCGHPPPPVGIEPDAALGWYGDGGVAPSQGTRAPNLFCPASVSCGGLDLVGRQIILRPPTFRRPEFPSSNNLLFTRPLPPGKELTSPGSVVHWHAEFSSSSDKLGEIRFT
jgi:hypothetical protein